MRHFIRHPTDIPIQVAADAGHPLPASHLLRNVGLGGLSMQSEVALQPDAVVMLRIPLVRPAFETKARVVWCREHAGSFDVGVEFLDPEDAFRARMVEQVCYIEKYRQDVYRREGRSLTAEQAAAEWIDKYASRFPDPPVGDIH